MTFEGSRIGNDDLAQILPVSDTTISGYNDLNSGNNRGTIRRRSVIELRREEDITQEQPPRQRRRIEYPAQSNFVDHTLNHHVTVQENNETDRVVLEQEGFDPDVIDGVNEGVTEIGGDATAQQVNETDRVELEHEGANRNVIGGVNGIIGDPVADLNLIECIDGEIRGDAAAVVDPPLAANDRDPMDDNVDNLDIAGTATAGSQRALRFTIRGHNAFSIAARDDITPGHPTTYGTFAPLDALVLFYCVRDNFVILPHPIWRRIIEAAGGVVQENNNALVNHDPVVQ